MSLFRVQSSGFGVRVALVTLLLVVAGCGFEPIYKKDGVSESGGVNLAKIKVEKINSGREGQILQTHLEDMFNPTGAPVTPKYRLDVDVRHHKFAKAVEQSKEVQRYDIEVNAKFSLKDAVTGEVILTDNSRIIGGFDAVPSDFSTYTAEEDGLRRSMKEVAQDIRRKLVEYFISPVRKNEDSTAGRGYNDSETILEEHGLGHVK